MLFYRLPFLLAPLIACASLGCRNGGPPTQVERAVDVKARAPKALFANAPDTVTRPNLFARFTRPCGAALPPDTSLDDASDALIAEAILPSFDRTTEQVAIVRDGSTLGVPDCRGHVTSHFDDPERVPRMPPGEIAVERLAIGPGREVVWISTGFMIGLCDSPLGFLALVREESHRIEVEGVRSWHDSCSRAGTATLLSFGAEGSKVDALLVPRTPLGNDEPGGKSGQNAFVLRGGELVFAGFVAESYAESPFNEITHGWIASMQAEIRSHTRGIVADETWTFEPRGLPEAEQREKKVTRLYTIEGDNLEATPRDDPQP